MQNSFQELLIIFLFIQLQSQTLLFFVQLSPDNELVQLLGQVGIGSLSLLKTIFLVILVPMRVVELQNQQIPRPYLSFLKKHLGDITLEGLRMTGLVILWSLLLIVPGLFKQIRWYFMPFIVIEDKKYDLGEVDPLDRSNQLVKGITLQIAFIAIADFVVQYGLDSLGQSFGGYFQFLGLFLSGILTLGVSVYTYILLFSIYQQRSTEIPHKED